MRIRMLFAIAVLLTSCRETANGGYVEVTGKLFIFNYRVATATYVVTLGKLRPLSDGMIVQAAFDDPAGGSTIIVDQKVWPKLEKIAIESPPVFCVVKDRPYAFKIVLKGADGAVLQELRGSITSSLDQSALPDRPLVVGPVYTPNPELKGRPDGHLPGLENMTCKI